MRHQSEEGRDLHTSRRWFACIACTCLTTSLDQHNKQFHPRENEDNVEDQEQHNHSTTTVRLVLPDQVELTAVFARDTQVASVLLYWEEECRNHLEEDKEVVVEVGGREIDIEQFEVTLAELGAEEDQEITLAYKLVKETVPLSRADKALDECENRLVKNNSESVEPSLEEVCLKI